jgi:hypothetical protein
MPVTPTNYLRSRYGRLVPHSRLLPSVRKKRLSSYVPFLEFKTKLPALSNGRLWRMSDLVTYYVDQSHKKL